MEEDDLLGEDQREQDLRFKLQRGSGSEGFGRQHQGGSYARGAMGIGILVVRVVAVA